jgi:hypothetical protein
MFVAWWGQVTNCTRKALTMQGLDKTNVMVDFKLLMTKT